MFSTTLNTTGLVVVFQVLGELFERWWEELFFLPEIWGKEIIGTADSLESCLGEVSEGWGTTAGTKTDFKNEFWTIQSLYHIKKLLSSINMTIIYSIISFWTKLFLWWKWTLQFRNIHDANRLDFVVLVKESYCSKIISPDNSIDNIFEL